ncbi:hypothetical protein K435DRAFT_802828 [Dendrothele bispora CBS 962.96]|uniref:Uncharacterized protein n=1 Tax=Dendrothele bispora (strain CBS 962.96) TaxID=1314807 RepID=A0A4S8LJK6_DENBC|nr:hypothetical protein K435DRAFT_802828 [Dendrothele bispora CBS 962.96]
MIILQQAQLHRPRGLRKVDNFEGHSHELSKVLRSSLCCRPRHPKLTKEGSMALVNRIYIKSLFVMVDKEYFIKDETTVEKSKIKLTEILRVQHAADACPVLLTQVNSNAHAHASE